MNNFSTNMNQYLEKVKALRQRLLELECYNRQCQQQVEQLTQQLTQERVARQQAEERLQLVLTSAQMVAWDIDLSANRAICSPNALEVWGIQEGTGEDFLAAIHPDDRQKVMQAAERAIAGEKIYSQEHRVIRPDGVTRWLNSQGQVYLDDTGRSIRTIGLSVDVTARKQTEAALRESEERLRVANERFQLAAKAVNCLIYDWDLQLDRVERTDGLTRLLGCSLEEAEPTGKWWQARIHPDDLPLIQDRALVSLTKDDYFTSEYRILNKSNQYIYVLDQCLVVERDANGNPTRIVGSTTDISDRKRAELQLQESQRFIQQIADALPGTLYVYDMLEQRNVYVNRQIGELLGYTPEQIQAFGDRLFAELIHPEDFANLGSEIERLDRAKNGEIVDHEYRMRHANGEWRWLWSRNTVSTRMPDGRAHQVVGTVHDITDRKRAEVELRQREQEFRTLVENTPDIIVRYDRDLRHLYINPSIERVLGIAPEHFIGKTGVELGFTDARSQSWYATLQQVFTTGQSRSIEYEFPNLKGELRFYQARFIPELVEGEQIKTVLGVATDITEYKKSEAALAKSNQTLQAIVQASPLAIMGLRSDGTVRIWNPAAERIFGWTQEEVLGKFLPAIPDNKRDEFLNNLAVTIEGQGLVGVETQRQKKGNILFDVELWSAPVNETQAGISCLSVVADITERKRVEEERKRVEDQLRKSEQRLQLAQQAGRIGTWEWNLQTNEVSWSDGIWTLLALEPNSITVNRESFTRFIHPDDREQAFRGVEVALAQGDDYYDEFRVIRPDGKICWFISKGRVIRTPDGQPERLLGINVDITDRKRAEESLRQSEERYRYLAESIPQLVWTANAEGVLIDVNQRWRTFTGLTLAQAKTEGWEAVVHPDDVPILAQNWAIAQQNGTYYQAEGRMRRADGVYRWHLHQAVPLKNQQGQSIKWFGTATDIEDQKQLEQQRIHLLQQEQVAREQAETANRIKDEFLAVLSHELRTPLNPILGWTRLLRTRRFDPAATDRALETIERNAKLQAQLIEDLLDVSRILQGKVGLKACPVNLVTTIEAALETVKLSAEAKGIQIQTLLDSQVGQVNGDANRIQQVVWNLLSNAVKFTPSSGRVEVRLDQIGNCAQIQVSDTGQGISPDFLPHVFEYFRQADSSTTRKFGGLGLGLAIVRHIVELHGGTVKAESLGHGMGATFTVQLPLMVSVQTPALEVLPTQETINLKDMCILIVDDEADMQDLIRCILEEQGAKVRLAASAAEALQHLAESVPDLLISDIGMPGMDGYALIGQIRSTLSEQQKMIPAIALTAYAGDINQRLALSAGFQKHVPKPVEPETLMQAIATLLGQATPI